jgi:hypothetical protein
MKTASEKQNAATALFFEHAAQDEQSWFRETRFDLHVFCNTAFRSEFHPVANYALDYAREHGLTHIVEMGAGTVPLTTLMAQSPKSKGIKLTACDRNPHIALYEELEGRYGNVRALKYQVDFSELHTWEPSTMLLLLGTFPALPNEIRQAAVKNMTESAERVMVWEFVRKTPLSMFLASLTFFVALLLPLAWIHKPGRFRRVLWCWLIPFVPFMAAHDGICWCLRSWTDAEWNEALERVMPKARIACVKSRMNSQVVIW